MEWISIKQQSHRDKLEIIKLELKETRDDSVKKFLLLLKKRNEDEITRLEEWRNK